MISVKPMAEPVASPGKSFSSSLLAIVMMLGPAMKSMGEKWAPVCSEISVCSSTAMSESMSELVDIFLLHIEL